MVELDHCQLAVLIVAEDRVIASCAADEARVKWVFEIPDRKRISSEVIHIILSFGSRDSRRASWRTRRRQV